MFYISPEGIEMEDNGVRETDAKYREEINKKILSILDMKGIKYTTIYGNTEERIKLIKQTLFL